MRFKCIRVGCLARQAAVCVAGVVFVSVLPTAAWAYPAEAMSSFSSWAHAESENLLQIPLARNLNAQWTSTSGLANMDTSDVLPMLPRSFTAEDLSKASIFEDVHTHRPHVGWFEEKLGDVVGFQACFGYCRAVATSAVPEPGKNSFMLAGLLALLFAVSRRRGTKGVG